MWWHNKNTNQKFDQNGHLSPSECWFSFFLFRFVIINFIFLRQNDGDNAFAFRFLPFFILMKWNSLIKLILFYQIISLVFFLFVIFVNSLFTIYGTNSNYFLFLLGSTNCYSDSGYAFIGSFACISRFNCTFIAKWEWNVAFYDRRRLLVHKHIQFGITIWFDDRRLHDGSLWQTNHIGNTANSNHCSLDCYGKRTISRCSVYESSVLGNFWRFWTTDMPGDIDLILTFSA